MGSDVAPFTPKGIGATSAIEFHAMRRAGVNNVLTDDG